MSRPSRGIDCPECGFHFLIDGSRKRTCSYCNYVWSCSSNSYKLPCPKCKEINIF